MSERVGRCYELAWKEVTHLWLSRYAQKDLTLIHGTIRDTYFGNKGAFICHAWVRVKDHVWEPITMASMPEVVFMRLFDAEVIHEYTVAQAIEQANESGHSGPWHPMPEHLQKTLIQIETEERP